MLKTFLIGIKDLRIAFRDRAALVLMLAAPFLLTLGLGLVTGRFSGNTSGGLADIPVLIVNLDKAELGNALVEVFNSEDLAELVEPQMIEDAATARLMIDQDKASAAVIIPEGFTRSVIPAEGEFTNTDIEGQEAVQVEILANPTKPTSSGVVRAIVDEFMSRVEEGRTSGITAIAQMITSGRITPEQAEQAGIEMGQRLQGQPADDSLAIELRTSDQGGQAVEFDPLAYIAPGMALMFLMYTVSHGGRSILAEKAQGTLPRLLVTPTTSSQILGGKVFGIFLTGAAQMLILIVASFLFFQLRWGDPLAVLVLVLSAVFAATGWGMLITSTASSPGQVANLGTALMLIFGLLGGSLIDLASMPQFIQFLSKITPNAWALDGFQTLGLGGGLGSVLRPIMALLVMGILLFAAATYFFGKRKVVQS
jgi:ABC-2 type transport system permease protein